LGHAKDQMTVSVKKNEIQKRDGSRFSVLRGVADFNSKKH